MGELITFHRDKSRLFAAMERLNLFLQMLFLSWNLLLGHNTKFDKDSHVKLHCRRTTKQFWVFLHGHLENVIHNIDAVEVVFQVDHAPDKDGGVTTDRFGRLLRNAFEIEFALFFDRYSEWLKARNSDRHRWPPAWNFARVVRNAIAHGGTVNIDSHNAPKVAWRGVEYDHTKKGRRIEDDIAVGDLVLLMTEMDEDLNALGAPQLPYSP